jgi:hypothetical protein
LLHSPQQSGNRFRAPSKPIVSKLKIFGLDTGAARCGEEPFAFCSLRYPSPEWLARVQAAFQVLPDKKTLNE